MQSTPAPLPSTQSPGNWYYHFTNHFTTDSLHDLELFEKVLITELWEIFSGIPLATWKEFATGSKCPESIRDLNFGLGKLSKVFLPRYRTAY